MPPDEEISGGNAEKAPHVGGRGLHLMEWQIHNSKEFS